MRAILVPRYLETSYGSKFFQQNFSFSKIHASTKFMATVILTVTVVFNEIPFILVHGVKVKE